MKILKKSRILKENLGEALTPPPPTPRLLQIQGQVTPHAIVILPKTDGMEMLLCYEDEGVYVNTYGRITKDVVLQWGEMPTSVGTAPSPAWV